MKKLKISIYAISKNEEKHVQRWMNALKDADDIVVVDTGSEDRTVSLLKEAGARVYEYKSLPFRFDEARNMAMDYLSDDTDICVSMDLDEVILSGWREELERFWDVDLHTRAGYFFTWSYNADGSPNKQFIKEKIHRRDGFRWVHPVHEVLEYSGKIKDNTVFIPTITINHYPDNKKSRSHYLPLLELSAEENPNDSQVVFWLGREYMYYQQYDNAVKTLKKHLSLEGSVYEEERSASMRYIGFSYGELGNFYEAKSWFYKAIAETPRVREPYLYLARFLMYKNFNPALLYSISKEALKIDENNQSYLQEEACFSHEFYLYAAISGYYIGLYKEALETAKEGLKISPNDERLLEYKALIEQKLKGRAY